MSPPQPIIKPVVKEAPSRALAYEQQIARTSAAKQDDAEQADSSKEPAAAPTGAAPAAPAQAQSAPAPQAKAVAPAQSQPPAPERQSAPSDMAALPPEDEAEADNPDALPWERSGGPYGPGPGASAPPPPGAWRGEDDPGDPYQQDAEAWPGDEADPNAWPAGPQDEPQEWVQVLVSGAGMYGVASEDSPMLFAFPYGRALRVISRYGNWVEVTDPQSATTGWMKAQYLAPVAAPGPQQEAGAWYDEEPPRRRRGWFKRYGGFGDMINRAFGF